MVVVVIIAKLQTAQRDTEFTQQSSNCQESLTEESGVYIRMFDILYKINALYYAICLSYHTSTNLARVELSMSGVVDWSQYMIEKITKSVRVDTKFEQTSGQICCMHHM